jgi:hypothetical protein
LIRIVGLQRNAVPDKEFVLLQNQGGLRASIRGHVVASEVAFHAGDLGGGSHAFNDDVLVPPGMYVILYTGNGSPRWARTKDGQMVYYTYMNRSSAVWDSLPGAVHVLSTHHTYAEKPPALLLR